MCHENANVRMLILGRCVTRGRLCVALTPTLLFFFSVMRYKTIDVSVICMDVNDKYFAIYSYI